jgi:signal recognition particle subunit SRP9
VRIANFDEFLAKSEQLYLSAPDRTRYTFKYRNSDREVVLKVTDDRLCLQYKTSLQSEVKYVERLNELFFRLMSAAP